MGELLIPGQVAPHPKPQTLNPGPEQIEDNLEPELLCHVPIFPKCEEGTSLKVSKTFVLKMAQVKALTGLFVPFRSTAEIHCYPKLTEFPLLRSDVPTLDVCLGEKCSSNEKQNESPVIIPYPEPRRACGVRPRRPSREGTT